MRRLSIFAAALALFAVCSSTYAYYLYEVIDEGIWPKTWPEELEPLRKQSRTLVGPMVANQHFAIRFTKREEFEDAWPHILSVKTPGSPVFLVRGPNFFLEEGNKGVVVHCLPAIEPGQKSQPEEPIQGVANPRIQWMNTKYIDLIVDGDIVDLNRIPLPADTPIIDQRFEDKQKSK